MGFLTKEQREALWGPAKPLTPEMEERVDQHIGDNLIVKPVKGKKKEA